MYLKHVLESLGTELLWREFADDEFKFIGLKLYVEAVGTEFLWRKFARRELAGSKIVLKDLLGPEFDWCEFTGVEFAGFECGIIETDVLETGALGTDVLGADVLGTDVLGTDVLETDVLETDVPETDVLEIDALETDALGTDALETDVLETDALGTDALGTGVAVIVLSEFVLFEMTALLITVGESDEPETKRIERSSASEFWARVTARFSTVLLELINLIRFFLLSSIKCLRCFCSYSDKVSMIFSITLDTTAFRLSVVILSLQIGHNSFVFKSISFVAFHWRIQDKQKVCEQLRIVGST